MLLTVVTDKQISTVCVIAIFNHLSPKSDQHQFSPYNIDLKSREKVMRINKMITKDKML